MPGIVIIGNGVAGASAALAARERDPRSDITLVSDETDYFFSRTALMYVFMDRLSRKALEPYERGVWEAQRIGRVRDRVVDIQAGAAGGTLKLRSGQSLAFDKLLLATGSVPRRLAAEGLAEVTDGVVNFVTMGDLDACERLTPSTRQAVVVGGGLIGIELVECLLHHGVKVTFLVREPWYWPIALGREEGRMIEAHMRHHGVDLRTEDELARVERDGAGRVSAVVTKKGERLPCQLLGVAIGVEPQIAWLREVSKPPALGRGVLVDAELRTSLPSVWSAGDCAEVRLDGAEGKGLVEQIWYSAKRQGELAGRNLTGAGERYRPPLFFNSAKFFDIEYTTVGQATRLGPSARSLFRRHQRRDISQRIVHQDGAVIGFNMLGSRWDHAVLSRWVEERRAPEWVMAHLGEAQFDVEFGRANLGEMQESEIVVQ